MITVEIVTCGCSCLFFSLVKIVDSCYKIIDLRLSYKTNRFKSFYQFLLRSIFGKLIFVAFLFKINYPEFMQRLSSNQKIVVLHVITKLPSDNYGALRIFQKKNNFEESFILIRFINFYCGLTLLNYVFRRINSLFKIWFLFEYFRI